jgi:hypothetical protein
MIQATIRNKDTSTAVLDVLTSVWEIKANEIT